MNLKKIALTILALSALGVSAFFYRKFSTQEVVKPKFGDVIESIYGLGTVTTDQIYHLRSGTTLNVRNLFVKEGDLVRVNDPLVRLDANTMRSQIGGTVTSVACKDGELVPPQLAIVTVTNLDNLILEVSLEQQEQQRIAIARALIMKPKIIFADEPTGNLDSANGQLVMNLFKRINKERGTTIIYVTHDQQFAQMSSRQINIVDGAI